MTAIRLALILTALGLAGTACVPRTGYPPPEPEPAPAPEPEREPGQPPPPEQPPAPEPEPPSSAPRTAAEASGEAVVALLDRGDQLVSSGEYGRAAASIERALDVEPRNPFVYQRLARLRLEQGQPGQAETMARKSNSLGGDNPYLQAENWALIAQALRTQGDSVAADSAASRAEHFQNRIR